MIIEIELLPNGKIFYAELSYCKMFNSKKKVDHLLLTKPNDRSHAISILSWYQSLVKFRSKSYVIVAECLLVAFLIRLLDDTSSDISFHDILNRCVMWQVYWNLKSITSSCLPLGRGRSTSDPGRDWTWITGRQVIVLLTSNIRTLKSQSDPNEVLSSCLAAKRPSGFGWNDKKKI